MRVRPDTWSAIEAASRSSAGRRKRRGNGPGPKCLSGELPSGTRAAVQDAVGLARAVGDEVMPDDGVVELERRRLARGAGERLGHIDHQVVQAPAALMRGS